MTQANVSEIQFDGTLGLGEGGDKEIGSERDGYGNGWLAIYGSMFTEDNDFSWCGHHEYGRYWRRNFSLYGPEL
jgi:hypothetical protein